MDGVLADFDRHHETLFKPPTPAASFSGAEGQADE
jgi:hypothetical protein